MSGKIRLNPPGFTLLEVLLVVILLGIISAIAIPSISNTASEMKLDSAAREVVSVIQYTQSLAIKEGKNHQVIFHEGQDRFWCEEGATGLTVLNPLNKRPYEVDFRYNKYVQGVDIALAEFGGVGRNSLEFNMLGEAMDSGIIILDYAGFQRTINVDAPLGRMTVN